MRKVLTQKMKLSIKDFFSQVVPSGNCIFVRINRGDPIDW